MKRIILAIGLMMCVISAKAENDRFQDKDWIPIAKSLDGKEELRARKDKIEEKVSGWFQYKRKNETDTVLYYANCNSSQILQAAGITHDTKGQVKEEWQDKEWRIVYPDTLEEDVYGVICEGKDSIERRFEKMIEDEIERFKEKNKIK